MLAQSIPDNPLPSFISAHEPLAPKTWFQTGGNAKLYAKPSTPQEFAQAISFAHQNKLEIFILGEGANILISDEGFDGLVIHPHVNNISHNNDLLTAGAGVKLPDLIDYCLNNNLVGLEEFSGIPGTVGGAVFINLHYFEFLISQFLVSAAIVEKESGILTTVTNDWFHFDYNQSTLHEKKHYLVEATFKLKKVSDLDVAFARGRRQEIIRHRARRYPQSHTCGSFFRNFHPQEVNLEIDGKKMIYVAYYLDKIGVKGNLKIGNAMVSYQHANMIVNCGNGTSNDIIAVAKKMQELVQKEYGIIPQVECQLIGFKEWPLHE